MFVWLVTSFSSCADLLVVEESFWQQCYRTLVNVSLDHIKQYLDFGPGVKRTSWQIEYTLFLMLKMDALIDFTLIFSNFVMNIHRPDKLSQITTPETDECETVKSKGLSVFLFHLCPWKAWKRMAHLLKKCISSYTNSESITCFFGASRHFATSFSDIEKRITGKRITDLRHFMSSINVRHCSGQAKRQAAAASEMPVFRYAGKYSKRHSNVHVCGFSFTGALGIPHFVAPKGTKHRRRKQYVTNPYKLPMPKKVSILEPIHFSFLFKSFMQ